MKGKYVALKTTAEDRKELEIIHLPLSRILKEEAEETVKNSSITTKHLNLILTFRSHHEIFIRRSWYSDYGH